MQKQALRFVLDDYQVDTGRKLNVHKTFRRRPGRLLNVLFTFNLRPVSTGCTSSYELPLEKSGKPTKNLARERPLCIRVYKTLKV